MSQKDFVAIALQPGGALKTEATTARFFPPLTSESISLSREDMEITETLGARAPAAREYGGRLYEGDLEFAARPNTLPALLAMFMGTPTTTKVGTPYATGQTLSLGAVTSPTAAGNYNVFEVTTAGTSGSAEPTWVTTTPGTSTTSATGGSAVWTYKGKAAQHVFNPVGAGKAPFPASVWTVNQDVTPAIVDKYVGVKGNELSLEIEVNSYLMTTAGVLAAQLIQNATAPSASRDTSKKWAFHQVGAQLAIPSVAAGALTSVPLNNFSFNFNNNLVDDQFSLGSKEVEALPDGNIETEVTFTPQTDLELHYRRALLDSPEDVRLVLTGTGSTIAGTSTNTIANTLKVDLKRLQYAEAPVDIDAGETLRFVEVTANPVLDDATGNLLEITVINSDDGTYYTA